jgi:hypothetical protein
MSRFTPCRLRVAQLVSLVLVACLALAAVALAAKPVKGARYSGHLAGVGSTGTVTFKVSKNGKKVTGLTVAPFFPNTCGSGGPLPKYTSKPARIKKGKFTTTVFVVTDTGTKLVAGKATGTFTAHRKEKGTLRPLKLPKNCTKTFKYSTKAKKKH